MFKEDNFRPKLVVSLFEAFRNIYFNASSHQIRMVKDLTNLTSISTNFHTL